MPRASCGGVGGSMASPTLFLGATPKSCSDRHWLVLVSLCTICASVAEMARAVSNLDISHEFFVSASHFFWCGCCWRNRWKLDFSRTSRRCFNVRRNVWLYSGYKFVRQLTEVLICFTCFLIFVFFMWTWARILKSLFCYPEHVANVLACVFKDPSSIFFLLQTNIGFPIHGIRGSDGIMMCSAASCSGSDFLFALNQSYGRPGPRQPASRQKRVAGKNLPDRILAEAKEGRQRYPTPKLCARPNSQKKGYARVVCAAQLSKKVAALIKKASDGRTRAPQVHGNRASKTVCGPRIVRMRLCGTFPAIVAAATVPPNLASGTTTTILQCNSNNFTSVQQQ